MCSAYRPHLCDTKRSFSSKTHTFENVVQRKLRLNSDVTSHGQRTVVGFRDAHCVSVWTAGKTLRCRQKGVGEFSVRNRCYLKTH